MAAAALSVSLRALPIVAFKCPSAQIYVLWPLPPYLSVHKYVYFGHFNLTFSAQIYVFRPLQPYLSVHKYVYFGR
jgi:hypothetical protein